jgi:hypothetical protein
MNRTRRPLAVVLAILAGLSMYLSFGALYEVALATGMPPERAVVWPIVIDVVTVTMMFIGLWTTGRTRFARVAPWAVMTTFGLFTIAGNALSVETAPEGSIKVAVWIAVVAHSIPALALLVTTHVAAVTVFDTTKAETAPAEPQEAPQAPTKPRTKPTAVPKLTLALEATEPAQRPKLVGTISRDEQRAQVLRLAQDEQLTVRQIEQRTGVAKSTVARWLQSA